MNKAVMTGTVITGLAGLISTSPAYAGSARVELFPNTGGVMNEMIVNASTDAKFPVGYFARNRLLLGYDGASTEMLLQEINVGNFHGFSLVAQLLFAKEVAIPRAGLLYRTTVTDSYGSVAISSSLVSTVAENPLLEYRFTAGYTAPPFHFGGALRLEAEQHLWFNTDEPAATTKAHVGYKKDHLVAGVAAEMDSGIGKDIVFRPGVFARLEF